MRASLALLAVGAAGQSFKYDDWILAKARRGDPHCKPPERHTQVGVGTGNNRMVMLQNLGNGNTFTDRVRMNCIIVDVRHHPNSTESQCGPQEDLPYHTWMVAEQEDGVVHKWHVDNIMGGSVDEIVYSTQKPANFSLQFSSEHENDDCDYWVTHSIDYCVYGMPNCPPTVRAIDVQYTLPTMTAMTPTSIYKREQVAFTFLQTHQAHPGDRVKAIHRDAFPPGQVDPCVYEGQHAFHMVRGSKDDSSEVDEEGNLAYYKHVFHKVGLYYICYGPHQDDGTIDYQEVATMTVFGGNPDYFSMTYRHARGPGQLPTYVFTFTGEHLDLRPHRAQNGSINGQGDRAKLVYQKDDCSDELQAGVPGAGGTFLGIDLGPDDNPSAHEASYDVHFRTGGRFRLCYQRYGHEWIEVPNLEDIDEGHFSHRKPGQGTPAPLPQPGYEGGAGAGAATPVPTPAPPVPAVCQAYQGSVPPRAKQPDFPTILQFTLTGNNGQLPFAFIDQLASLIGVPTAVLDTSDLAVGASMGNAHMSILKLHVSVHCGVWTVHGRPGCDSKEKKNMLIFLGTRRSDGHIQNPCLSALGVSDVKEVQVQGTIVCIGTTGKDGTCTSSANVASAAHGGANAPEKHGALFTVAMVFAILVGIGAIVVTGLWAWRRNGYAEPSEMFASVTKGIPWGPGSPTREMI